MLISTLTSGHKVGDPHNCCRLASVLRLRTRLWPSGLWSTWRRSM